MRNRRFHRAFSTTDLLIVIAIIGILIGLLLPAVQSARESARAMNCASNMHQVGIAILADSVGRDQFTSAAVYRDGSPVSVKLSTVVPGSSGAAKPTRAPYSFLVKLLLNLEAANVYRQINFDEHEAFHPKNAELASTNMRIFRCPSFRGPEQTTSKDYADPKPALTQYKSIGAVTWSALDDPKTTNTDGSLGGAIHPYGPVSVDSLARDGASNTILIAETKEPKYAVWWDGTTASMPGFHPGVDTGNKATTPAINYKTKEHPVLLTKKQFGGTEDMAWGPSSEHAGGDVNHSFADGHTTMITPDIDSDVYKAYITRAGGERIFAN